MVAMSTLIGIEELANASWQTDPMDATDLRNAIAHYEETLDSAKEERDNAIREAKAEGMTQAEIVRATGYTRETIRRILDPAIAEAVRKAAAERRTTKKES